MNHLENKTDEEMIILAKQNGCKNEVIGSLYLKYEPEMVSYMSKLCLNKQLAEDIVQDAFVKIYTSFDSYTPKDAKFKTWMVKIMLNTFIDNFRKQRVRSFLNNELSKGYSIGSSETEKTILGNEIFLILKQGINSLPPMYKEIMRLFYFKGHSYKELEKKLNLSESRVKTHLHRGRDLLRRKFINNRIYFY